jgi:hypothetical protein
MCNSLPIGVSLDDAGCQMVWNGTGGATTVDNQTEAVGSVPATSSQYLASTSTPSIPATLSSVSSPVHLATTVLRSTSTHAIVTIFVLPSPTSATHLVDEENLLQNDGGDQVWVHAFH